jgi:predicted small secreted protein
MVRMKHVIPTILLFAAFALTACKNGTQNVVSQDVEVDSTDIVSSSPIYHQLLEELDSTEIYDDSILYGYWFKPHEACAVNIFFHKNGRFEFKYYIVENDTTIIDVVKKGTFKIGEADVNKARVITMVSDDGWDSNVFNGKIHYRCNRTHYYLEDKNSGLYLVKGSD